MKITKANATSKKLKVKDLLIGDTFDFDGRLFIVTGMSQNNDVQTLEFRSEKNAMPVIFDHFPDSGANKIVTKVEIDEVKYHEVKEV